MSDIFLNIWKHWLGKLLVTITFLILLFVIFSAAIFERPIDLWGLKINTCNVEKIVVVRDTIFTGGNYEPKRKGKVDVLNRQEANSPTIKSGIKGDNKGVVGDVNGKNLNIGDNYGQVGDIYTGIKQRVFADEDFEQLLKDLPSPKFSYQILAEGDKESGNLANQIFEKLKILGYNVRIATAMNLGGDGKIFLMPGLNDSMRMIIVQPAPNISSY